MPAIVAGSQKRSGVNKFGRKFVTHITQMKKDEIETLQTLYHHFDDDIAEIKRYMDMLFLENTHQGCRIKHFLTKLAGAPIYDDSDLTPAEVHRIFHIIMIGIRDSTVKDIWRHVKDEFPRKRAIKEKLQHSFSVTLYDFANSNLDHWFENKRCKN